jgi:superfamily I DNA and/or RNA helicase
VIIDEASQVSLERSLPLLSIGRKIIISGDLKQLQPSDFFQSKLIEEYENCYETEDQYYDSGLQDIEDSSSLLEFVSKKYNSLMLNYHYRAIKRELMQFSNICFYDGHLVVANQNGSGDKIALELVEVEGV